MKKIILLLSNRRDLVDAEWFKYKKEMLAR